MEQTQIKANKMGTVPVPKLLLSMGIPMMLSMLGQALYNMVDTLFVSRIPDTAQVADMGDKAINALTIAYPIQILMISLIVGVGIGTNSLLAHSLGRKDREQASRIGGNAMLICFCFFVIIGLFGLFGAKAFIESQTSDPVVAQLGTAYLRIVSIFSLGTIGYMCIEKVVMGCGNTRATMVGQLSGALTNIILDPILIFGVGPVPALGVRGAAWATVIGQFVSLFVISYVHFFRNREINKGWRYLRPRKDILKQYCVVSIPAIFQQIMLPILSYGLNLILGTISDAAITAYGVYYKLQYFVTMPIFGLNNASIPVVSYNLGAENRERIRQTIQYALLYTLAFLALCVVILQLFTGPIVGIFSLGEESRALCIRAVRYITLGYLFVGANIILQGVCQALGNGVYSLIVSALRYVVIVLPLAYGFSRTAAATSLVWWSVPIAETVGCAVAALLTWQLYRRRVTALG
jgi:putative MATE family efflux protein